MSLRNSQSSFPDLAMLHLTGGRVSSWDGLLSPEGCTSDPYDRVHPCLCLGAVSQTLGILPTHGLCLTLSPLPRTFSLSAPSCLPSSPPPGPSPQWCFLWHHPSHFKLQTTPRHSLPHLPVSWLSIAFTVS